MKTQLLSVFCFLFLISCGSDQPKEDYTVSTENPIERDSNDTKPFEEKAESPKSKTVYAWVDKLRIRENPSLDAKEVVKVAEGTALEFTGEISKDEIEVVLRGRRMKAPFYKIKTPTGEVGWTFAGGLSNHPVDVESYRVAIAFDERHLSEEEDSGDFSYYLYDAGQLLVGTGIDLMFVNEKFHSVEIKNGKGDIIGVENISDYVKENTTGIVCIEKGGKTSFVEYDPGMGGEVKKVFGVD